MHTASEFETTDIEKEGAALAVTLDDPSAALARLLGPEMSLNSTLPLSEQVCAYACAHPLCVHTHVVVRACVCMYACVCALRVIVLGLQHTF